jgi:DNA-binding winged helix-turn-helix (wHTH) protein/tetratricopeptide (TPR) repeat protein
MPIQPARRSSALIRFGVFEADVYSGELRKNGVKVKIQDLPFRALRLLLSRPHEVLSRDQFRQALWPEDVFVDFDHGISSAINRLRDALGDSAENPIFIETVDRRGYRWIAPTHVPAPLPPPPGPVLIKAPGTPVSKSGPDAFHRWRWSLAFPAAALLLAVWSFWPAHRSARAGTTKGPVVAVRTSDASHHSSNAEAEQFYLKGRYYWEKRTPDGLNKALDYFTQAIVRDPSYSPAYVGLADCYNLLREYTVMPASDAYPRALAAAQKAVELDDRSSEAHASLAFALFYGNWDAAAAEREFRRALDLNPNNAVAHHWYATYLSTIGRQPEAVAEIERAQTLDPASKSVLADKGDLLCAAGRREEGIALLKQLEATEPDFVSPHRYLKSTFFESGDYAQYLAEWKQEAILMRDDSTLKLVDAAAKGFATAGAQGMLRNTLALQKKLYESGLQSPYSVAETDSLLGNKQEALQYLKVAYDKHDDSIVRLESDPAFTNLNQEPAYRDLVGKLGFPARK